MTPPGAGHPTVADRKGERGAGLLRSIIGLAILAIIAVVVLIAVNGNKNNAKADVQVQGCRPDANGGQPTATGQVTNHSSKRSTYLITVKFMAAGNEVSEGIASLKAVDPDDPAAFQLTGDRSAKGPLTCELYKVVRTHLPGQ